MKSLFRLLPLCTLLALPLAAAEIPARVAELAAGEIAALAADPVIVSAVTAQNSRGATLADVTAADKVWMATPGTADFMKLVIDSPAGEHLRAWRKSRPYIAEIIVMDRLGANVAITEKTSDYWQGDEPKFSASFKDAGLVFIDRMKFDDSTQTYSVQVSVPVRDPAGTLLGVLCCGLDLEHL
jgi:hypothetical protein